MSEVHDRFRSASAGAEWIFHRPPSTPAAMLRDLADFAEAHDIGWDRYGERGAVAELEARVAGLLGKPAAVMFPSGVMAQQATLRAWCDRAGSRRVALPDLSHLVRHEQDGPRRVLGLELEWLTTGPRTATDEDLAAVGGRLGAALVELPLRDAGCLLPPWDELVALSAAARERRVRLHADGARIWESVSYWGRDLAEVAELFDSVYVSLYKGLGGSSGALVACPEDLAGELRSWRQRMGGTLYSMTTAALGGLKGLDEHLSDFAEHRAWAVALAVALRERGFRTVPDEPHIATFLAYAPGTAEEVNERVIAFVEERGLVPCGLWSGADVPGWVQTELTCYESASRRDPAEVADTMAAAVGLGAAHP
ncbi:low specificity L-threonine aldolase [Nocardioides sp. zg-1228]|uniref:threonine aldolase family protein n=1 Tax=Nocardioides sp. zg-1228 TaxID=2763008 RepID=UPI001642A974|nr:beta-eliminating lyase-related protein [Nocardioides sp. zg-1228]MBC2934237.1 threonine aldolase [Nocardioides sp. zg-1228]QSF59018.1 threonine aldolase [Nocardioides sp. zg-1228]